MLLILDCIINFSKVSYLYIKGTNDWFVVTDSVRRITGVYFLCHLEEQVCVVCSRPTLISGFHPPQDSICPGRLPLLPTDQPQAHGGGEGYKEWLRVPIQTRFL